MSKSLVDQDGKVYPLNIDSQTELMVGRYGIPGFDPRSKIRTGNSNVTPPKKKRKKRRKTNYLNKK